MHDLTQFTLSDMVKCGAALRRLGAAANTMEDVAVAVVRYLFEQFVAKDKGERSCALVRFFKTHPYGELDPKLRKFAQGMLGGASPVPAMKCMTLLATAGLKPEWNSREMSAGYKAIPLASERLVAQFPMISQLVKQFGLEIRSVMEPMPLLLLDMAQVSYNVFYVPDAVGCPYIPAQEEFVIPFGIRSVVGFGGMLPSGNLFVVIMFMRVRVPRNTADMFKTLALSTKSAIMQVEGRPLFN